LAIDRRDEASGCDSGQPWLCRAESIQASGIIRIPLSGLRRMIEL
jgi:hypothetical protein